MITFHTPLTTEGEFATLGLANENFFSNIQKDTFIINAARGGIIDEKALLNSGCDCAIDCWDGEPETNDKLRNCALIATPHIAGYSADGKHNASQQVIVAVAKALNIIPCSIEGLPEWESTNAKGDELRKLLLKNYNILQDSEALKAEPEKFEWFRSNYPIRRELKHI